MYHYLIYWAKFSDKCVFMHPTVCCRSPAGGEAGNNRRPSVATGISKHFLVASTGIPPGLFSPLYKAQYALLLQEEGKRIYCLVSSPVSLVQLLLRATFGPLAESNSPQRTFLVLWTFGPFWEQMSLVGGEGVNHSRIRPDHPAFQPS